MGERVFYALSTLCYAKSGQQPPKVWDEWR